MPRFLTALAFLAPALLLAGEGRVAPPADPPAKGGDASSLLPDGSQLKGVMIPRYDEHHKLVGVLKAKVMKLVSDGVVEGTSIAIEFFNPDRTTRGRIYLEKAMIYQENGTFARLAANAPVEFNTDRFTATGQGFHYRFDTGRGFLTGPVTTTIINPAKTAMNTPGSSLRATAIAGLSLISAAASASGNPPTPVSEAELAAMHADAHSNAATLAEKTAATRTELQEDLAQSESASQAATTFLVQADLPPVPADEIKPPDKPLELQPALGDTVIRCDGGMYLDSKEGVFVYRKNVTVKDPRFDLSGINELKVFFARKAPKDPAPKDAPKDEKDAKPKGGLDGKLGADVGEVEKIVATGAVVMVQKPQDGKEPIRASGAIFSYNIKSDTAIITGGFPWVIQGRQGFKALESSPTLRIHPKSSSFDTEGRWETILNLEDMKR